MVRNNYGMKKELKLHTFPDPTGPTIASNLLHYIATICNIEYIKKYCIPGL